MNILWGGVCMHVWSFIHTNPHSWRKCRAHSWVSQISSSPHLSLAHLLYRCAPTPTTSRPSPGEPEGPDGAWLFPPPQRHTLPLSDPSAIWGNQGLPLGHIPGAHVWLEEAGHPQIPCCLCSNILMEQPWGQDDKDLTQHRKIPLQHSLTAMPTFHT